LKSLSFVPPVREAAIRWNYDRVQDGVHETNEGLAAREPETSFALGGRVQTEMDLALVCNAPGTMHPQDITISAHELLRILAPSSAGAKNARLIFAVELAWLTPKVA